MWWLVLVLGIIFVALVFSAAIGNTDVGDDKDYRRNTNNFIDWMM